VLSIISFAAFGFGVIMAVVSLCLCPSARRSIEASKGALTGEGLVNAAKAISWANIALTAVVGIGLAVIFILIEIFDDTGEFAALLSGAA